MTRVLKSTLTAFAILTGMAGYAAADTPSMATQSSQENFAAKPGCGLYNACYRVSDRVQQRTSGVLSLSAQPRDSDFSEALGNRGYRSGWGTFNVLDSIH